MGLGRPAEALDGREPAVAVVVPGNDRIIAKRNEKWCLLGDNKGDPDSRRCCDDFTHQAPANQCRVRQEGRLFLESCRTIISEIKSVEQEFVRAKAAPNGKLRVSLPLIGTFMMPVIARFMHRYPEIELDLDLSDDPREVVAGGYDATIQTEVPADSRLLSRRLATYRLVIVGSPSYFARASTPKTPTDLAMHSCLHHKSTATGKLRRWPLDGPATEHEIILPTTATASAIGALISLVELGRGLACLPLFFGSPADRGGLACERP